MLTVLTCRALIYLISHLSSDLLVDAICKTKSCYTDIGLSYVASNWRYVFLPSNYLSDRTSSSSRSTLVGEIGLKAFDRLA